MQELDYTGQYGGALATAFAAGAVAAFGFLAAIGKFMWGVIGRAKDDQIAGKNDTIEEMRKAAEEDRARCAAMEVRLTQRIQQLEGVILSMSPAWMRQDIERTFAAGAAAAEQKT